jgi:hypothetical protein
MASGSMAAATLRTNAMDAVTNALSVSVQNHCSQSATIIQSNNHNAQPAMFTDQLHRPNIGYIST